MKSPARKITLTLVLVIMAAVSVFGQGFTAKKIWDLTVAVNVPGASIWVDNLLIRGNTTKVSGGPHNVKVQADGYYDFNGPVVVLGNQTFNVELQPAGFALMIRVNVPNATVLVDGADVTGVVPNVAAGPHSIQVTAPGFRPYAANVNVSGPMTMDVQLKRMAGFPLTVNANVPNATVMLNNIAKGGTPYTEYLPPGPYALRVTAPGYADFAANINLTKPITMNVQLQRQLPPPTFSVIIPPPYLNPEQGQGERSRIRIFVDDQQVNSGNEMERFQVPPGRHSIRVASGAFSIQVGNIDMQPGTSYTFELSMDLKVNMVKTGQ
ncbi:MAG: PEGA domain-containing protein [Spirochaetia bacterium]|jgi:hypothetical protein